MKKNLSTSGEIKNASRILEAFRTLKSYISMNKRLKLFFQQILD